MHKFVHNIIFEIYKPDVERMRVVIVLAPFQYGLYHILSGFVLYLTRLVNIAFAVRSRFVTGFANLPSENRGI